MASDEDVIYSQFSKLYRFVSSASDSKWVMSGTGEAKLLKHKKNGKVRFMLQQEKTMKVLSNHLVTDVPPYCDLLPNANGDTCWVWTAQDFADNEMKIEKLALKFGDREKAMFFQAQFENAKNSNNVVQPTEVEKPHQMDEEMSQLRETNADLTSKFDDATRQNRELSEKRHQMDEEMSQLRASLKQKDETNADLTSKLDDATRQNRELSEKHHQMDLEMSQLIETNADLTSKFDDAMRQNRELSEKHHQMDEEMSQLRASLKQKDETNAGLTIQLETATRQTRELSDKVADQDAQLANRSSKQQAHPMPAEPPGQLRMSPNPAENQRRPSQRALTATPERASQQEAHPMPAEPPQQLRMRPNPAENQRRPSQRALTATPERASQQEQMRPKVVKDQLQRPASVGAGQPQQMQQKSGRFSLVSQGNPSQMALGKGRCSSPDLGKGQKRTSGVITGVDGFGCARVASQRKSLQNLTKASDQQPSTSQFRPEPRRRSAFLGDWKNSRGGTVIITGGDNGWLTIDSTHTRKRYNIRTDEFWHGSKLHLLNSTGTVDCWPPSRITWSNDSEWTRIEESHGRSRRTGSLWN